MKKIKNFRIDLNGDSLKNIVKVKKTIEEFTDNDDINYLISKISNLLEVPNEILLKKTKQIIYRSFDYYDKSPKFKINLNFFESIKYLIFFLSFIPFRKNILLKKNQREKVDVILDNVEDAYVINKFGKFLSFFKKPLILTNKKVLKKINKKNMSALIINEHFSFLSNNILKKKKIALLRLTVSLLFFSVKHRINFLKIFFPSFYTTLKYNKIFSYYDSEYLIFDRVYHSCPLRNYLFKKFGGRKILCVQSHLAEGTISVFSDIDILVTFGEEEDTKKKLELLGGKVNETFCSGSIGMEWRLSTIKEIEKLRPIDILVVGLNPYCWLGTSNKIPEIYYQQMKWINEISKKNKDLNIVYKHHINFKGDIKEKEIFKSSKIETVIRPKGNLNSYHYLLNSKLILSFGSTMILEGLSLGKKCYFLDPGKNNSTFFGNLSYLDKIRISNFNELEFIVKKVVIDSKKYEIEKNNKFCLPHKGSSQKIYNYLFN